MSADKPITDAELVEWAADQGQGPYLKGRVKRLVADLQRTRTRLGKAEDFLQRFIGETAVLPKKLRYDDLIDAAVRFRDNKDGEAS